MMPSVSSLMAPGFVVITAATSDDKFGIMTTLGFRCTHQLTGSPLYQVTHCRLSILMVWISRQSGMTSWRWFLAQCFFPDHYQQYKMGRASIVAVIVTISRDIANVLVLHAITLCMLWKLYTCNNYPWMCRKQLRCSILIWWRHEMETPFASLANCERSRSVIDGFSSQMARNTKLW